MRKMQFAVLAIMVTLGSYASTNTKVESINTSTESTLEQVKKRTIAEKIMVGKWIGQLEDKELTVVIEKIEGNKIYGYNQVGKNKRAIKGTFVSEENEEPCTKYYTATLAEPGDDKWDGVFEITFNGYIASSLKTGECTGNDYKGSSAGGSWKSNNGKLNKQLRLATPENLDM